MTDPLGEDDSTEEGGTETRGRKPVPSHIKRKFARRVLRRLADLQMNQQDLADASGVTKDAISTYCRGRSLPSGQRLKRLAQALQLDERDLLPERFPEVEPRKSTAAPPSAPEEEPLFRMTIYPSGEQVLIEMKQMVAPELAAEIVRLLEEYRKLLKAAAKPDDDPPPLPDHVGTAAVA